jgi:hypothetical protein
VLSHRPPPPRSTEIYLAKARSVADEIGHRGEIVAPAELDVIDL